MNLNNNNINFQKSSKGGITLVDAKIKGFGNSSIELINKELILKSIESTYTVKKSIDDIDYLIYSKGNFFFDDTIYIGVNGEQYEINCKNNEIGLRNLYDNLVKIKADDYKSKPLLTHDNNNPIDEINDTSVNDDNPTPSAAEEIRNFYNLMKEGIISEEEFEEKKKELLKPK